MENSEFHENNLKEYSDAKKIIILGLANSGKTSIILSLKGVTNLNSYFTLKPTKGIDISDICEEGGRFLIWDFAGQDIFRKRHLKEFKTKAYGANSLIYVIDVQDIEKYDTAMDFLKLVLKFDLVKEMNVTIYLHKYDPFLELEPDNEINKRLEKFIPKIQEVVSNSGIQDVNIFKTSIYTKFRKLSI